MRERHALTDIHVLRSERVNALFGCVVVRGKMSTQALLHVFTRIYSASNISIRNHKCNNRILSFLSKLFWFFSSRFNSLFDIIMLPGTINTIFCFQRSFHDYKKLQHFYKINSVKNSFVTLIFQPIFKLFF